MKEGIIMKPLFAIFGATGNLTFKKLLPALAALHHQGHLGKDTQIVLIGRSSHTLDSYLEFAKTQMKEVELIQELIPMMSYFTLDFGSLASYQDLARTITNLQVDQKILYLAVGPELFEPIAKYISEAGIAPKGDLSSKIAFEKPFGDNLETAKQINQLLWSYFDESQIYRVDHYLGKEMIQNLLVMRFANRIFENNWNHLSIEKVTIKAKETEGVMNRGNYYDKAGALKDMFQSHLLQMASLVAMESPETFDEAGIRKQKVDVLQYFSVHPKDVIFGQYPGYLEEKNIQADSKTETFVALKGYFNTPRWYHVPFYFITGKKLEEKVSEIIIDFKHNPQVKSLWPSQDFVKNQLVIRVAPEEGVTFRLNVKQPGLSDHIQVMNMDYCHDCQYVGNKPEAYERLLLDLIRGVSTLFSRWDEIESSWEIVDKIKEVAKPILRYSSLSELKTQIKKLWKEDL